VTLKRQAEHTTAWVTGASALASSPTLVMTDSGLSPSTRYHYRATLTARDSSVSDDSNQKDVTTLAGPPVPPPPVPVPVPIPIPVPVPVPVPVPPLPLPTIRVVGSSVVAAGENLLTEARLPQATDGVVVVTAPPDGSRTTATVVDPATGAILRRVNLTPQPSGRQSSAWAAQGTLLWGLDEDSRALIAWDLTTGLRIRSVPLNVPALQSYSADLIVTSTGSLFIAWRAVNVRFATFQIAVALVRPDGTVLGPTLLGPVDLSLWLANSNLQIAYGATNLCCVEAPDGTLLLTLNSDGAPDLRYAAFDPVNLTLLDPFDFAGAAFPQFDRNELVTAQSTLDLPIMPCNEQLNVCAVSDPAMDRVLLAYQDSKGGYYAYDYNVADPMARPLLVSLTTPIGLVPGVLHRLAEVPQDIPRGFDSPVTLSLALGGMLMAYCPIQGFIPSDKPSYGGSLRQLGLYSLLVNSSNEAFVRLVLPDGRMSDPVSLGPCSRQIASAPGAPVIVTRDPLGNVMASVVGVAS